MHTPNDPAQQTLPATGDGIPRLIYLGRILWLCFFPLMTVVVGDLVLICVQQAREALVAFSDSLSQRAFFAIAFILWMVSAWYVARLLLGKRFKPDLIGECRSPEFAERLARYLPRILALIAALPIPIVLWINDSSLWPLALALLVAGVLVLLGLVFRRQFARKRHQEWVRKWQRRPHESFEHFDALSGSARGFIAALFVVSFGVCLSLPVFMSHFARPVGAPTLLLLALMSWTLFGGFVLTYWPRSYGLPAMTWIPLVALFAFYCSNENHPVAPPSAVKNAPRKDVGEVFKDWLHQRADSNEPVIFVATAGGASRAAYWTTAALGMLEDDARRPDGSEGPRRFADNIFVISSVSGGSLGAAAFVATLDLTDRPGPRPRGCSSVQQVGDSFTGQDHLSTVLGFMLFPDLVQRFLPVPLTEWDRSRGLEEVWADDWDTLLEVCAPDSKMTGPWREALTRVPARSAASHPLPRLALNTTALAAGQQVLEAPFSLSRPDVFDILSGALATSSLTLAQAVHNSARFPYVSPGGVVRLSQSGAIWDRMGDGGYVEASATLMLTQIIESLIDQSLIQDSGDPKDCPADTRKCFIRRDQLRILVLDNSPTFGGSYLCDVASAGSEARSPRPRNVPIEGKPLWPPGPDALLPVIGAFSTRDGRAVGAEVDLLKLAGGCTVRYAELRLPKPGPKEEEPSMNWMLNSASRGQIDRVLKSPGTSPFQPDPNALLAENLAIVRSWFAKSSAH